MLTAIMLVLLLYCFYRIVKFIWFRAPPYADYSSSYLDSAEEVYYNTEIEGRTDRYYDPKTHNMHVPYKKEENGN